ncbi:MAG: LptF/LptG family permease, partial [Fibrobacteres bacterium]|nr:LptF/LptG family permease [Fibrobacterota bacterium]
LSIVDSIFNKGLSVFDVLNLFILNMAWMVALSLPMAVLISTLIAYGRMAGDNEIVAFKAAGIHPIKVIAPSIIISMIVGAGLVWFNDRVLPEANHKAAALITDISQRKPVAFIEEGYVIESFPGYRLLIGRISPLSGELHDVRIYHRDRDKQTLTFAEKGRLDYLNSGTIVKLTLYNGESHQEGGNAPDDYFRTIFKEQSVYLDNETSQNNIAGDHMRGDREMSVKMMNEKIKTFKSDAERERQEIKKLMETTPSRKIDSLAGVAETAHFSFGNISYAAQQNCYNEERRRQLQLERHSFYLANSERQISKYGVEIHKKFSIPVACLVFALIGAPLGIMARTGGLGAGSFYSIAFFVIYWIFLIGGETLADNMIVPPWLAMWSPNLIVGGIGGWLLVRMIKERDYSVTLRISHALSRFRKKKSSGEEN